MVGGLEAADLPGHRAGERAALVPEQLALDERARNRRAVDADHRPMASRARVVNRLRDDLFACSRFAQQQNGRRRRGDLRHLGENTLHGRTVRDDDGGAHPRGPRGVSRPVVLAAPARPLQFLTGRLQRQRLRLAGERLAEEAGGDSKLLDDAEGPGVRRVGGAQGQGRVRAFRLPGRGDGHDRAAPEPAVLEHGAVSRAGDVVQGPEPDRMAGPQAAVDERDGGHMRHIARQFGPLGPAVRGHRARAAARHPPHGRPIHQQRLAEVTEAVIHGFVEVLRVVSHEPGREVGQHAVDLQPGGRRSRP